MESVGIISLSFGVSGSVIGLQPIDDHAQGIKIPFRQQIVGGCNFAPMTAMTYQWRNPNTFALEQLQGGMLFIAQGPPAGRRRGSSGSVNMRAYQGDSFFVHPLVEIK